MSFEAKAKTIPEWIKEFRKKRIQDCGSCIVIGTKEACLDCQEVLSKQPKLILLKDMEKEIWKLEKLIEKTKHLIETLKTR